MFCSLLCSEVSHCVFVLFCVQGIEFLVSKKLLEKTAEDIAEFLYTCEELDKVKIGEVLGEPYVYTHTQNSHLHSQEKL